MKLAFAAVRDNELLMNGPDGSLYSIDEKKEIVVKDLMKFFRGCCSCESQSCKLCKALVTKFTNLPTKMKLSRHDITTDEWSLTLDGFRGKLDDNRTVASFYNNGGKAENKVPPYTTFKLVEGSVIDFRPPPQYRSERFSRHLKFMVVADADADDGVGEEEAEEEEEEAEVVVVVDADIDADADVVDADDGDKDALEEEELEVEETEVVVVADAVDADDGVKEAGEQSVRFP